MKLTELCFVSSIEHFSNEIFYEIFDYLDGYDIYQAFSNLNCRLDDLIMSSSFDMKIQTSSRTTFDSHYEQFLHSNQHHIISIDFDNQIILNQFITLFPIDLLFSRLQSFVLNQISTFQLLQLLFYFKSLPNLSSLNICLHSYHHDNLGHIYQILFRLSLKYLRMEILDCEELVLILPIATSDRLSSIKYLFIGHVCPLNKLTEILSFTPQLTHLYCDDVIESDDENIDFNALRKLSDLIYLKLTLYDFDFDEFEPFLIKVSSQLEMFSITMECCEENFFDSDRWEHLIVQHMSHLKRFFFRYIDVNIIDLQVYPSYSLLNRFTSSFWIDRRWIFQISLNMNRLSYSIHPYKEIWIDFQEHLHINQDPINTIGHSSNLYVPVIEFTVEHILLTEKHKLQFNTMRTILDTIKITCLDIHCDQMTVSMFIRFFKALPNLYSMRISDLSLFKPMDLSVQDIMILNVVLKMNKIIKLILRNIPAIEQIDLMLDLFPCLYYFGLEDVLDVDLENYFRCILLNIKEKNSFHLKTISIVSTDATYDKVKTLHRMIDSENFLNNYTIHRQYNRFDLQWK